MPDFRGGLSKKSRDSTWQILRHSFPLDKHNLDVLTKAISQPLGSCHPSWACSHYHYPTLRRHYFSFLHLPRSYDAPHLDGSQGISATLVAKREYDLETEG